MLMDEASRLWVEINSRDKYHNKINDSPNCKGGIDDICILICFIEYRDDE